jgi:phosphoglycerol transferase MdoB-like AlkP superfamily enzyme
LPYDFFLRLFFLGVLLFTLSRLVFALQNPESLPEEGNKLWVFLFGLRYDLTALAWIALPLMLLHAYPTKFILSKGGKSSTVILFSILIAICLLMNYADTGWFSFQRKRSTADVFAVLSAGDDLSRNLPAYIADYWHLTLLWLLSVVVFVRSGRRMIQNNSNPEFAPIFYRILGAILFTAIYFVTIRGGVQLKPLSTQAAATLYGPQSAPLILNTPYTIIKSIGNTALEEANYFTAEQAAEIFPLHFQMVNSNANQKNVIVIILESFSKEYTGKQADGKLFTPFLDSLSVAGISYKNSFANGKRSIEGLPAILASVPALMNEPFITSQYNTNRINSIASLLTKKGYSSSFFHGGNNGTMGFDNFTAAAGYKKYYGKSEYKGDAINDDGHWGIYDHAFYEFMIEKLKTEKEPFTSTVFSLSSHHPYSVPAGREKLYPEGKIPILKSIAYADDALRTFFKLAESQSWYKNTVFIITADHTGPGYTDAGNSATGMFAVPIIIYYDGVQPAVKQEIAQHIDILPTALHMAGYEGAYSSMGRNLFDSTRKPFAINYNSGYWQLITNENLVRWDGENTHACNESSNNTSGNCKSDFDFLKAGLQQYRNALISNSLTTE